ncbi:hypothetical protein BDB00DRAFT_808017 [Zychaea mexicana]|uniref:uncharacterized protein n=1 Tax=Zychaea mexicana TaxID=64656 RepID=UPI0022FEC52F|nr:uncharacterized protein BDB00DRAFT_808017 [Zychaea mexicana]KAI9496608.1 hypothetical protein BDB00DRAFT_808017 [Zychaea mexicana]
MMTSNVQEPHRSNSARKAPRKFSVTDSAKHPHLHQIHETLHNLKEDARESYAIHKQEKEERRAKRPQDGKTNPME